MHESRKAQTRLWPYFISPPACHCLTTEESCLGKSRVACGAWGPPGVMCGTCGWSKGGNLLLLLLLCCCCYAAAAMSLLAVLPASTKINVHCLPGTRSLRGPWAAHAHCRLPLLPPQGFALAGPKGRMWGIKITHGARPQRRHVWFRWWFATQAWLLCSQEGNTCLLYFK